MSLANTLQNHPPSLSLTAFLSTQVFCLSRGKCAPPEMCDGNWVVEEEVQGDMGSVCRPGQVCVAYSVVDNRRDASHVTIETSNISLG